MAIPEFESQVVVFPPWMMPGPAISAIESGRPLSHSVVLAAQEAEHFQSTVP